MGDAFNAIQYDDADVMLTGGAEAAITPDGPGGFANMRALSERNDDPRPRASRPWDRIAMGSSSPKGAGILVFEELEHAKARGAKYLRRDPRLRLRAPTPATSRSPTNKATAPRVDGPALCATAS